MQSPFPIERQAKRKALLAAVDALREPVAQHAEAAEAQGRLPQPLVDALIASRLFTLKLPAVLGGAEADPVTQIEVIEAVSALEPSVGWCVMIGATGIGMPGAFVGEDAIPTMFPGGRIPTGAIIAMPNGRAVPVEGGYRLSGRWPFVSGVRHAQWVTAGVQVERTPGAPPEHRMMVFPTAAAEIHDTWHVAGLQATGSCDVSLADHFVPEAFCWDRMSPPPQRGGPVYRLALPGFVANEHAAVALGVGRAALDAVIGVAHAKRRGFTPAASSLEARPAFQRAIGRGELRLRAARALTLEANEEAFALLQADKVVPPRLQAELRSVATYATEVAAEVTTEAFRYAGGGAAYRSQKLQRLLRDINVAAQHLMVSDVTYETHGQFALGLPDADPMR